MANALFPLRYFVMISQIHIFTKKVESMYLQWRGVIECMVYLCMSQNPLLIFSHNVNLLINGFSSC